MSAPYFSIVIPTCRRNDLLARCLESVRPGAQTAEAACYEVIVTDDGRNPGADAMIREKFPWAKWVQGPSRGPAANRNNGAHQAAGEWICFIDDDCIASAGWLAAFREAARDESLDLMEGRTTIPDKTDNPFQHAVHNKSGGAYWSCNLAIRRARFLEVGGFDEDFLEAASEDMEFAHRFHAHQYRSKFFPEALVLHPVRPMGWRSIWKRLFMVRWTALYWYKVNQVLHLSDSAAMNVVHALGDTLVTQVRLTWHDFQRWNRPHWKSRTFWFIWRWVTLPISLPYYLYWVHRYHEELSAKQAAGAAT